MTMEKIIYYTQLMGKEYGHMAQHCRGMPLQIYCHKGDWAGEVIDTGTGQYLLQMETETVLNNTIRDKEWQDHEEVTAVLYITLVLSPIFLFVGTINNVASIVVMYRLSYKLWSICMYLYILAILDLFILYVECGNNWLYALTEYTQNISHQIMVLTEATCKVYTFIFSFAVHFHSWIGVTILIECAISMKKPHEQIIRRHREHTRAIVIFVAVLLFLINCHFFWTYGLIKPSVLAQIPYTICSYTREWSDNFQDYIWPWMNATVGNLAPFLASLILVFIIQYMLHYRKSCDVEMYEKSKQYYIEIESFNEIRKILRVLGYIFVVVMLLKSFQSIFQFLVEQLQVLPNTYDLQLRYGLAESLLKVIYFLYRSTKFVIYLVFSRRVRKEVKMLLKKMMKTGCRKVVKRKDQDFTGQTTSLVHSGSSLRKGKDLTSDTITTMV